MNHVEISAGLLANNDCIGRGYRAVCHREGLPACRACCRDKRDCSIGFIERDACCAARNLSYRAA